MGRGYLVRNSSSDWTVQRRSGSADGVSTSGLVMVGWLMSLASASADLAAAAAVGAHKPSVSIVECGDGAVYWCCFASLSGGTMTLG